MSRPPVRAAGAALTGILLLGGACTYYNAIYNAEHLFEEAERARRAGRDSVAVALYQDVIRKAAGGYRDEPDGGWAYEAAFLLGRAHLRTGDLSAARAALRRSLDLAENPDERLAAQVYLGVVDAELGDTRGAVARINEALAGTRVAPARAEGHLHRGRILLAGGNPDAGWWDLDRAAEEDPGLRVEATLERMRWGIALGDLPRTRESVRRLLSYPEAASRVTVLTARLRDAEARWGAGAAAELLEGVADGAWERDVRDGMALEQARILRRAGRPAEAAEMARRVSDGRGPASAEARLELAAWTLAEADDLSDAYALRGLLLPGSDDARVSALLESLDAFETLVFGGLDAPLAWFAAGEVARDRLAAPILARDLFLAYASSVPDAPWAPKAILAALQLSTEEAERERLRARLERHARSPYVLAARGRPAVGFEALEEELMARLNEIGPR